MLKIIHAADIHAGKPVSFELDKERGYIRRREIETSLWRIVELTKEEKADVLLIAGDMFEHTYTGASWIKDASMLFSTILNTQVFISPGNHDPLLPDSLYLSTDWPSNVVVFQSNKPSKVSLDALNLDIYGLGWRAYIERRRPFEGFRVFEQSRRSIVLAHGDLRKDSEYMPISEEDIAYSRVDYFALGHIHTPFMKDIGFSKAVYPGCPEPLDFGDQGKRGIVVTVFPDKQVSGVSKAQSEFIPMAVREVVGAQIDLSGIETDEQVRNAILSVAGLDSRKRDMWKVSLSGRLDLDLFLDLDLLEHELRDDFFCLRLVPEFIPDYDLALLIDPSNQSLEAKFARKQRELERVAEESGDMRAARVASLAMYYGLDALRQGKVFTGRRMT